MWLSKILMYINHCLDFDLQCFLVGYYRSKPLNVYYNHLWSILLANYDLFLNLTNNPRTSVVFMALTFSQKLLASVQFVKHNDSKFSWSSSNNSSIIRLNLTNKLYFVTSCLYVFNIKANRDYNSMRSRCG